MVITVTVKAVVQELLVAVILQLRWVSSLEIRNKDTSVRGYYQGVTAAYTIGRIFLVHYGPII